MTVLAMCLFQVVESAFRAGIGHVVQLTSEEQVIRPHAGRSIATMQNAVLGWNDSVMQFPRETVRSCIDRLFVRATDVNTAIARLIGGSSPEPTRSSLLNLGPKSLYQRFH